MRYMVLLLPLIVACTNTIVNDKVSAEFTGAHLSLTDEGLVALHQMWYRG